MNNSQDRKPKKPIIYYYAVVIMILILMNLFMLTQMDQAQIVDSSYSTCITET